jgi:hypothetical protein
MVHPGLLGLRAGRSPLGCVHRRKRRPEHVRGSGAAHLAGARCSGVGRGMSRRDRAVPTAEGLSAKRGSLDPDVPLVRALSPSCRSASSAARHARVDAAERVPWRTPKKTRHRRAAFPAFSPATASPQSGSPRRSRKLLACSCFSPEQPSLRRLSGAAWRPGSCVRWSRWSSA